jgi:hypothetical protein
MDRTAVCTGVQDRRGAAPTLGRHWALRPGEQRAVTKRGGRSTCTRRPWWWCCCPGAVGGGSNVGAGAGSSSDSPRPTLLDHGSSMVPLHRTGRGHGGNSQGGAGRTATPATRGRSPCQMPGARDSEPRISELPSAGGRAPTTRTTHRPPVKASWRPGTPVALFLYQHRHTHSSLITLGPALPPNSGRGPSAEQKICERAHCPHVNR